MKAIRTGCLLTTLACIGTLSPATMAIEQAVGKTEQNVPLLTAPDYVLQPDDVLDISVVGEPEMTKSVTVLEDGKISYPYVGEITVAGLTLQEVQKRITTKVARQLQNPEIIVSLARRANKTASILGAVRKTGKFVLQPDWRLLDLLAESGGITATRPEWATAVLVRSSGETFPVDLLRLVTLAGSKDNVLVKAGDILLVREVEQAQTQVQVLGEVLKPGALPIPSDGSIAAAIAVAGGPTPLAALAKVAILRGDETIPVNLQSLMQGGKLVGGTKLQPGDTLVVPANRQTFAVLGAVTKPGALLYPEEKQLDVLSALALAGGQTPSADLKNVMLLRSEPDSAKPTKIKIDVWSMSKGDLSQNITIRPTDVLYVPDKSGSRKIGSDMLASLPGLLLFLR